MIGPASDLIELAFVVVTFVLMMGAAVGGIIFLVAAWRMMKAHEYLARSAADIADGLRERSET